MLPIFECPEVGLRKNFGELFERRKWNDGVVFAVVEKRVLRLQFQFRWKRKTRERIAVLILIENTGDQEYTADLFRKFVLGKIFHQK